MDGRSLCGNEINVGCGRGLYPPDIIVFTYGQAFLTAVSAYGPSSVTFPHSLLIRKQSYQIVPTLVPDGSPAG